MSVSGTKQTDTPELTPGTCLKALLVLAVVALLLGGVVGSVIAARNYASHSIYVVDIRPTHLVSEPTPLKITTARGERIAFVIEIGGAEEWASSGISMTLSEVQNTFQIIEPKKISWDDTYHIRIGAGAQTQGSIVIPTSIDGPEDRLLAGNILGDVIQPGTLGNVTQSIDIPIQLQLRSPESVHQSNGRNTLYLLVGINALLFGGLYLTLIGLCLRLWQKTRELAMGKAAKKMRWWDLIGARIPGMAACQILSALFWLLLAWIFITDYPGVIFGNHLPDVSGSILLLAVLLGVFIFLLVLYSTAGDEGKTHPA